MGQIKRQKIADLYEQADRQEQKAKHMPIRGGLDEIYQRIWLAQAKRKRKKARRLERELRDCDSDYFENRND